MRSLYWEKITNTSGPQPRPRHGHRAVAIKDLMVVFGGGNEGIVDEIHVFNTATKQWFVPSTKGEIPPGCAAYGLVVDNTRLLAFGGMVEYGKYSNDLYELQASKWSWKKIKHYSSKSRPVPCARLGHSFTIIEKKIYLFGGLSNESEDPKRNVPKYLNDLHVLEIPHKTQNTDGRDITIREYTWSTPVASNQGPSARESHTGVSFYDPNYQASMLVIYGGMSGYRLGDLWFFNTETLSWLRPDVKGTPPLPRSLHTATVINNKMFVFGGWVPIATTTKNICDINPEKEWRCTNTLASLDFATMTWELISPESSDDSLPKPRAGHSAVGIHSKLYVWSGRDAYRKAWNNQVCCKDLWSIELAPPSIPGKVTLLKASANKLEVTWLPSPSATYYVLQIQKYKTPAQSTPKSAKMNAAASARKQLASISASAALSKSATYNPIIDVNRFKKPIETLEKTSSGTGAPILTIVKSPALESKTAAGATANASLENQTQPIQVRAIKTISPTVKVITSGGSSGASLMANLSSLNESGGSGSGSNAVGSTIATSAGATTTGIVQIAGSAATVASPTKTGVTPQSNIVRVITNSSTGSAILKPLNQSTTATVVSSASAAAMAASQPATTVNRSFSLTRGNNNNYVIRSNNVTTAQRVPVQKQVFVIQNNTLKPLVTTSAAQSQSSASLSANNVSTVSGANILTRVNSSGSTQMLVSGKNSTATPAKITVNASSAMAAVVAANASSSVASTTTSSASTAVLKANPNVKMVLVNAAGKPITANAQTVTAAASASAPGTRQVIIGGKTLTLKVAPKSTTANVILKNNIQTVSTSNNKIVLSSFPGETVTMTPATAAAATTASNNTNSSSGANANVSNNFDAAKIIVLKKNNEILTVNSATGSAAGAVAAAKTIKLIETEEDGVKVITHDLSNGKIIESVGLKGGGETFADDGLLTGSGDSSGAGAGAAAAACKRFAFDDEQQEIEEVIEFDPNDFCDKSEYDLVEYPKRKRRCVMTKPGLMGGVNENSIVTSAVSGRDNEDDDETNGDGLSTLALAAMGFASPAATNSVTRKESSVTPNLKTEDKGDETWYTVGILPSSSAEVTQFFYYDVENCNWDLKNLPDFGPLPKKGLEPGNAYKFRVAALNTYGLSGWTPTSAFKTCVPGYPGAPSCIKVAKANDGAYLSWDPPPTPLNEKLEYSVYLAVSANSNHFQPVGNPPLAFVRVYCGAANQCFVGNNSLSIAYIDTTNKPAIIFRIAAKNDKGFGPATQVRWIQTEIEKL